jgi:hypothetical protein
MAVLRNMVVQITGDTSGLQKSLGDAQKKINTSVGSMTKIAGTFSADMGGSIGKVQNLLGGLAGAGSAIGPVGIAAGVLAGGIALVSAAASKAGEILKDVTAKLIEFGSGCVEIGSDLVEVQNVVDVTFGKMAGHANSFAETAFRSFGLSELSAKRYTGTMGAMLKSMGLTENQAITMSIQMAKLAGDFASFYNIDTDEAFTKIRAGISGETEPLKQLGINMSVANLEAYALSQGIKVSYEKLDQASKALLRYNYLMSVSADAQGDFARNIGTWANQTRVLKLQWDSFRASIGQALIAALTPVIQVVNTLMSQLVALGQIINRIVGRFFGAQQASEGVAMAAGAVSDGMDDVANSMKRAGGAAKKLIAPFDQLNVLMGGGGGGGGGSLMPNFNLEPPKPPDTSEFDSWIDGFLEKFDFSKAIAAWENLKKAMKPLEEKAYKAWNWFKVNIMDPVSTWTVEQALPATLDVISAALGVLDAAIEALQPYGEWLWKTFLKPLGIWTGEKIIEGLTELKKKLDDLKEWIEDNPDKVQRMAQYILFLGEALAVAAAINLAVVLIAIAAAAAILLSPIIMVIAGFATLRETLTKSKEKFGELKKEITKTVSSIKTAFFDWKVWWIQRYLDVKNAFTGLPVELGEKFTEAKNKVQEAFEPVKKYFSDLWASVKSTFTGAGTQIANAIGGAFKTAMNNVFATIERIVNKFIDMINPILDAVGLIPGVKVNRIKKVSLPRLASGGWAKSPMSAIIGDNPGGGGEVALPLSGNTSWADIVADKLLAGLRPAMAGAGSGDIVIPVYLGNDLLETVVVKANARRNVKSNGRG